MKLEDRRPHLLGCVIITFAATIIGLGRSASAIAAADSPAIDRPAADPASPAHTNCNALREHDQIWLISTRALGCPSDAATPALQFWKYDGNGAWIDSTLAAFLAADDPKTATDFYVHGNFDSADDAVQQGLTIYSRLTAQAAVNQSLRFVIWSWPTDQGKHPLRTTRMHAHRSDVDAYYLGWLIGRIESRTKIGLIGYSLGARVATGALHLLGGGQLLGLTLPVDSKAPHRTVRAVLLAAAEDCDWLSPGHPNGEAVPFADRMLLLNNGCDSALKLYPHLERCSSAEALGYVGVCGPVDTQKIEQLDVCCTIGKQHEWSRYFYNDSLITDMLPILFLDGAK
ncbi:MAG TPA: hypothetical protein VG056_17570 [Pirellulales bacterium]|jgi:hypothetical protein|nr:hypothetical protein [Pirellulales bacterium]